MESSNWALEHSEALRHLLLKGLSFSDIRREINARFATTYTRSAIIGRARRMSLPTAPRIQSPPLAPTVPAAPRPLSQHQPRTPAIGHPPKSAFRPAEPARLRCVGIQPRLVPLLGLEPGECRYPYGGDAEGEEITFCGHARHPGSSYCLPHHRLTRGGGASSGRGPVVLRLVAVA